MEKVLLKRQLRIELAKVENELNINPYTREFIFGGNPKYSRTRNRRFESGPNGFETLLAVMLKHGLDETKRANIFPSAYHLGSLKSLPEDRQTLVKLAESVRRERRTNRKNIIHVSDSPETLKKEFESITSALKAITGTTFSKYKDRQNALRVVHLIDRMMPNSGFPEERSKRFLTLIKNPTNRFAFEVRDAFATPDSEENTYLLSELKAYFSIELEPETQDKIFALFSKLINQLDGARSRLDTLAYASGTLPQIIADYSDIIKTVEAFCLPDSNASRVLPDRLDMDLCVHLNRLEFLHYAGAHSEILELAKPTLQFISIRNELVSALSAITGGSRSEIDLRRKHFRLDDLLALVDGHSNLFLELVAKSLGYSLSRTKFEQSVPLAKELLFRDYILVYQDPQLVEQNVKVSFQEIIAALCAVCGVLVNPISYRPRIFGDDTQTRSVVTPLETHLGFIDGIFPKELPEGYMHLWHNRLHWIRSSLVGGQVATELKFRLMKLIWKLSIECVQPMEIELIEKNIARLFEHLNGINAANLRA